MRVLFAALAALLAAAPAQADDVQVVTDSQGVQTYTNLPPSQRKAEIKAKDENGVRVYTNVTGSSKHKSKSSLDTGDSRPAAEAANASVPEAPPLAALEPELTPPQPQPTADPGPAAGGQWVYTQQYGWVWMPYGDQYVSEGSADGEDPYAYAYDPGYGWTWLAAPWIWGWGAYPYFGALGPGRFGWYRGLVHSGYGWGGYRGGGPGHAGFSRGFAGGYRGGFGARGGSYGRSFGGGHGMQFRGGGGFRGAPAAHRPTYSGGGSYGGHVGGGGGGRGGGGRGGHR